MCDTEEVMFLLTLSVQMHAQSHLHTHPTQPYTLYTYTYTLRAWLEPTVSVYACITHVEHRWSNHKEQCVFVIYECMLNCSYDYFISTPDL